METCSDIYAMINNSAVTVLPVKHDITLENYRRLFKKALDHHATTQNTLILSKSIIDRTVLRLVNGNLDEMSHNINGKTTCEEREKLEKEEAIELHKHVQYCQQLLDNLSKNFGICLEALQKHVISKNHFTVHSKKLYDVIKGMLVSCSEQKTPLNSILKAYEVGIKDERFGKKIHDDIMVIFDRYHPKKAEESIKCLLYWNSHDFKGDIHKKDDEELVWLSVNSKQYHKEFRMKHFDNIKDIKRSYFSNGSIFTDITIVNSIIGHFPNNETEFFSLLFSKIYCEASALETVDKSIIDNEVQQFLNSEQCFCKNLLVLGSNNCLLEVLHFFYKECCMTDYFKTGTNAHTTRLHIQHVASIEGKLHFTFTLKRAFNIQEKETNQVVGILDLECTFSTEQHDPTEHPNNTLKKGNKRNKRSDKIFCTIHPMITPNHNLNENPDVLNKLKECLNPRIKERV